MHSHRHIATFFALLMAAALPTEMPGLANSADKNQELRAAVERTMEGRPGTEVVVDVTTGEILAAHELELAAHRLARPGSTVKPFVLMSLLNAGKLKTDERLQCRRPLLIGGVRMDCAHPVAVTDLNAEEAIAYSCNSYFAEAAVRLSPAELVQSLRRAALDSPSGLVKDEATGRIEMPRDREMLQLEALGDRGVEVTGLELLEAYRKLALRKRGDHGDAAAGRALRDGSGQASPAPTDGSRADATVFTALEEAVTYGMAHAVYVDGMKVAGKTGTAASRERARTHGFFVGYAPAEKPEIAVVVYLERGTGGDAAGVARGVFEVFAAAAANGRER